MSQDLNTQPAQAHFRSSKNIVEIKTNFCLSDPDQLPPEHTKEQMATALRELAQRIDEGREEEFLSSLKCGVTFAQFTNVRRIRKLVLTISARVGPNESFEPLAKAALAEYLIGADAARKKAMERDRDAWEIKFQASNGAVVTES